MDIDFIERLERRLEEELPALPAQLLMAPKGRETMLEPPSNRREASVMILIYPNNDDWKLVLIERPHNNPNDPHSGQISLPGGKLEETDPTYFDCALRETHEEIGIDSGEIGLVGELTSLYVPVSNFVIYPFVGFMGREPEFEPQASEVSQIIECSLEVFTEQKFRKKMDIDIKGAKLTDVPYFRVENKALWGATAMILSEFGEVLKQVY